MAPRLEKLAEAGALTSGGLSAASFAGIILLLQTSNLDLTGIISLSSFCVALPFLLISYANYKLVPRPHKIKSKAFAASLVIGGVSVFVGLIAAVMRVSLFAAFAFLIACLVALQLEERT